MYDTLEQFIEALESAGELRRIRARVSCRLEITQIADRVSKSPAANVSQDAKAFDPDHAHLGGHALLFENVEGSSVPLLINAFGSYRRMEMALGCHPQGHTPGGFEALADSIGRLLKPEPPVGLMEKLKKGMELARIASFAPKVVSHGRCQQVVQTGDQVNLLELPIIQCWPLDGQPDKVGYPWDAQRSGTAAGQGRYITLAGVYTIHPDDAGVDGPRLSRNIGMYRAQVIDRNHTAMHWHMHHDGARHWRAWKALGKPMPVALVLGGESVLPYAATAPLPAGISELLMAGFLHRRGIGLVACKTVDLHVPANADIVIEGFVSPSAGGVGFDPRRGGELGCEAVFEGPFGDHTGFYSLPDRYPVLTVTAITRTQKPVYPTTVVGLPPQEDYYLGKATERLFLPLLKTLIPDVLDYHLPMFGCFHNCVFVRIKKEYPLQARRVMHAIWGAGQMAWTKMIVVVDHDVDVHDEQSVLLHLCSQVDPGRDIEIVHGPLDILDHAAPYLGSGHKIGFDATRKIDGEQVNGHPIRDYPPILKMDRAIVELVNRRWQEYGF